jgi:hypothetical protein
MVVHLDLSFAFLFFLLLSIIRILAVFNIGTHTSGSVHIRIC